MAASGSTSKELSAEHKVEGVFEELKHIQRTFGYLPADKLKIVAERRGLHMRDIHQVASFYPHFHLKPPAKTEVHICADMTCHLRGACEMKAALQARFRGTSADDLSIKDVSCLGRCDTAPAMVINENYYDNLTLDMADDLVSRALVGRAPNPETHEVISPKLKTDPYDGQRPYTVVKTLLETKGWTQVVATLKDSALRGMGGAGFPTGTKWDVVRNAPGQRKWVVCNADESEPGTIKDRYIMTHLPHMLIEGMIVCGLVTGARKGIIYIRHEYEEQEHILKQEIERCYEEGILGERVMESDTPFDLSVFVSPGGYVCGEETALLEAIEGKRSEPRNKPPFPVFNGLWNEPTVINNVETFVFAAAILAKGAEWYKTAGLNGTVGVKFVGISGHVKNPGVFEVPMGISYTDLIMKYAGGPPDGKKVIGFAPSGPSSGYLPASMMTLPLDWNVMAKAGSMVGSGAIVVCAEGSCMLDMALSAVTFYRNESCGKCVPCRVGSQKMVDMLEGWTRGDYKPSDMGLLEELSHAMKEASICGLGQIAPAPIQSVIQHFREEVDEHLLQRHCRAGICFKGGRA